MKVKEDIIHELARLPKTFTDLYSIAFDRLAGLETSSFQLGLSSLQLLTVAVIPISWADILLLVSLPTTGLGRPVSKQELLDITSEFLEDEKEANRPRFVHSSAREYLETRWEFRQDLVNLKVSQMCLDYVRFASSPDTRHVIVMDIECTYAAAYLGDHIAATSPDSRNKAREIFDNFLVEPSTDGKESAMPLFKKWRNLLFQITVARLPVASLVSLAAQNPLLSFAARNPLLAVCVWGLDEYFDRIPGLGNDIQTHWEVESWENTMVEGELCGARTGLEMAILLERLSIIKRLSSLEILPQHMDNRDGSGITFLYYAIKKGKMKAAEALLECGANPNILNMERTPREVEEEGATHHRAPKTAMGFRGPNGITSPFAITNTGLAPIHWTVDHNNGFAFLKVLLHHGADPNLRNVNGNTPLQLALDAGRQRKAFFDALIAAGADVNARIDLGQTVLHLAAVMGLTETVETLLAAGADPTVQDIFHQTPYSLAMRSGRTTTAELLRHGMGLGSHQKPPTRNSQLSQQLGVPGGQDDDMGNLAQIIVEDYESPAAFPRVDSDGLVETNVFFQTPIAQSQANTVPEPDRLHSSQLTDLKGKSKLKPIFRKWFSR